MALKKHSGNTVLTVWKMAEPIAKDLGLDIWDLNFVKEGSNWYLRIFIDKPDGVSIDDCEAMSRAINDPLDKLDLIEQSYCLEICSPGIERELKRPEHFSKFKGYPVFARLIRPLDNKQKVINGVLKDFSDSEFTIKLQDGTSVTLNKKDVAFIKLDDFDNNLEDYIDE